MNGDVPKMIELLATVVVCSEAMKQPIDSADMLAMTSPGQPMARNDAQVPRPSRQTT